MITPVDHKSIATGNLREQNKRSNLIQVYDPFGDQCQELELAFTDVINARSIRNAKGVALDYIGEIVGQPRGLIDAGALPYFGFLPFATAEPFGSLTNPSLGGRLRSRFESSTTTRILTDNEYRTFIRAKVMANSTACTLDELADIINFVFDTSFTYIKENPDGTPASYRVVISKTLSNAEKLLLQTGYIPSPAGVLPEYVGNDIIDPDNPMIYSAQYTLAKELALVYNDQDPIEFFYDSSLSDNTGHQPVPAKQPTFEAHGFPVYADTSGYNARPFNQSASNRFNMDTMLDGYKVQLNINLDPGHSDNWDNSEPWDNTEEWPTQEQP
jgi:hypothetical protein